MKPEKNLPAVRERAGLPAADTGDDPPWVTDEMRRFIDQKFFEMIQKERDPDYKGSRTPEQIAKAAGLPTNCDWDWSTEHGVKWARYMRDAIIERFKTLTPELYATAFGCAIGKGDDLKIRGLGHLVTLLKRLDPEYGVTKSEVKAELSFVDALRSARKGDPS